MLGCDSCPMTRTRQLVSLNLEHARIGCIVFRMETVPREIIQDAWNHVSNNDEKASTELSREFFRAQPALAIFCTAQQENLGEDAEVSPLIDLTIAIWQAMTRVAGSQLPNAIPEEIDASEEAITKQLETLEEGSEMDLQTHAQRMIENHNQRELLGFGIEVLMSHAENPDHAPDSLGLEMIWLNTVVDCLDKLQPGAPRRTEFELDPDFLDFLGSELSEPPQPVVSEPKIGRNDPCPCGSGKKYKKCCFGK